MGAGEASSWIDSNVIDGTVNGAGWITRFSGTLSNWWDKWIIDGVLSQRTRHPGALALLSRTSCAMGIGAVVCAGDGGRVAGLRFLLRMALMGRVQRALSPM